MNLINCSLRLPPAPPAGQVVVYPVVVKPLMGYHKGYQNEIAWDGTNWVWFDPANINHIHLTPLAHVDPVVQWADPIAVQAVSPILAPTAILAVDDADTLYTVTLTDGGSTRINIIRLVREVTGLPLGESKALVESAPKPIKVGATKAAAEELRTKVTAAGGSSLVERES